MSRRIVHLCVLIACIAGVTPLAAQQGGGDRGEKKDPLPLEAARTVSIDRTSGTWISLDVSPDGQTIVFDYLGDLFTVPIGGGDATQLTSGMAFDVQPRFSPDGSRIVFASDRDGGQNIWIMALDGSDTVQVSKGGANRAESPEWTPDGEYIVASMGDFRGRQLPVLHLYHVDGGSGAKLITEEEERLKTIGAAFGPDPRWVWFAERQGDWTYNADLPQYQLAVYDRETGERFTRTSHYGSAFRPTLSPDGKWLVYGTRFDQGTGLMIRELATGEERWLAYPVQHDDQESRATLDVLPGMSFTPDSRFLVASYGGKIWKIPVDGGEAAEIPFHVSFDLALGPEVHFQYPIDDSPTFVVRQIRDAVPSPDGTRLAFSAMDHLWVADADGSNPRRLTESDASEQMPVWSPDGRWVAYVTWAGDQGQIMKMRADGRGRPQQLTQQGALYVQPAWSPDGQRIVAIRGPARGYRESDSPPQAVRAADELVWVSADGGDVALIAPTEGRSGPHFTQDPDRIYLTHRQDGLVSIRWDGTDQKAHVKVSGPKPAGSPQPMNADLILMAPRGDQALAEVNGQLYTVTVPLIGGETPTISVANPANASFPARKLTGAMGGEFPTWSADGRKVHWSLGNAHFTYDLDAAQAFADSVEAAEAAEAENEPGEEAEAGEPAQAGEQAMNEDEDDDEYVPSEIRVRITANRDIPHGTVVLRGGRAITMAGDEVIENADIVVRDNRIAAIGASGSVDVPADARVIDISGRTVIPGFVDTHSHMWPHWGVHRKDQWIYAANLAYGVTTTRDPQTSTTDVLTYADLVRAGEILGPRIYSTGPGIFWQESIADLDQARDVMKRYSEYFDTKYVKMYVAGNRQQRQWIIMAAREQHIMPTTEGSLNFRQNMTETIDGYPGLEHSLPIYPIYGDVVQVMAESGRIHTPTLLVSYGGPWAENWFYETEDVHGDAKLARFTPHEELDQVSLRRGQWFTYDEHVFPDHARFSNDLVQAGGLAGIGSHGQLQGLGYHWELWAIQSGGMSEHDALRVATILGARGLGFDGDVGSLEPGKIADLQVLDANPLDDIRNSNTIRYVMKNGRLYEGDTLREVYPVERDAPSYWWWSEVPEGLPGIH